MCVDRFVSLAKLCFSLSSGNHTGVKLTQPRQVTTASELLNLSMALPCERELRLPESNNENLTFSPQNPPLADFNIRCGSWSASRSVHALSL